MLFSPTRRPEYGTTYPNSLWHEHLRREKRNTSVDYDVGGSEEDADGGGRREDAEDDQAEPVDHLEGQLHGKLLSVMED